MEKINIAEFEKKLEEGENDFSNFIFENMDFSDRKFSDLDFSYSNFINVNFERAKLENSLLTNALLDDCNLKEACLKNSDLRRVSMRRIDPRKADIRGAKLYAAVLEGAKLDNIVFDEETENFRLHCPEKGAFIAYKKGLNNLIIKLLVPSDAKRTSSTMNCCRCDKAKVLEIKSFDGEKFYDEAWSTVAEDFCYKLGSWVYAENFNENRWYDSTGGIHFWMTEEEAKKY